MALQIKMSLLFTNNDVEGAVDDIVEFMEGKTDYEMYPFKQL